VTVDVTSLGCGDLGDRVLASRDDRWVVHHLGQPDRPRLGPQQLGDVLGRERGSRGLERRGRHARGDHHVGVERDLVGVVQERADAIDPEHVGDLVRVEDDGGGPPRERRPRELVEPELGRLQVHVPVDEAGEQDQARDVDPLAPPVARSDAGNVLADDRDVGLEELAGEHGQHPPPGEHKVGGLVAAGDGDPADEIARHPRRVAQPARVG